MQLPVIAVGLAIVAPAFAETVDASLYSNEAPLLWGPYRPNLYLGIRPRVPKSLIAGLMWGKLDEQDKSRQRDEEEVDLDKADWPRRTAAHGRTGRWHGYVWLEYI